MNLTHVLNLDPSFKPFGDGIEYDFFMFPSKCELGIKLHSWAAKEEYITITCRIKSSDDIMKLLMATDALKRNGWKNIDLFIPYVPYARQDRVMVLGESFSIKVFADLINSQGYNKVGIYDAHSDVTPALINNCVPYKNHTFVNKVLEKFKHHDYFIVSPDAGAYKKIFNLASSVGYRDEIITSNKIREVSSGKITKIQVDCADLLGRPVFIIDDICDGGGTFKMLSSELMKRNAGSIYLIVSHGIFSKGTELSGIEHTYCTNSFCDFPDSETLTQIKLYNGLLHY